MGGRASYHVLCPKCGSNRFIMCIATLGNVGLETHDDLTAEAGGYTDMDWSSTFNIGYTCETCGHEITGEDAKEIDKLMGKRWQLIFRGYRQEEN